jgi:hypothetical protein
MSLVHVSQLRCTDDSVVAASEHKFFVASHVLAYVFFTVRPQRFYWSITHG